MKTKLLKKWRQEAINRIGVFGSSDGTFSVIFDKSIIGDVSGWVEGFHEIGYQVVKVGIETLAEAISVCDSTRRSFILREARKEWNEKHYGSKQRYY